MLTIEVLQPSVSKNYGVQPLLLTFDIVHRYVLTIDILQPSLLTIDIVQQSLFTDGADEP